MNSVKDEDKTLSLRYKGGCQSKDGGRYNAGMGVDVLSLKRKPKSKVQMVE
jgi:hypothetical protein